MRTASLTVIVLSLACLAIVKSFHTPLGEYLLFPHCWPLDADDDNDEPIDCGGLKIEWENRPSSAVEYMEGDTVYLAVNITSTDIKHDADLASLCEKDCPADCSNATADNCCVWHADIIACYPGSPEDLQLCVPWNSDNSIESTGCGPFGSYNASILLHKPGFIVLLYHLQVRNMSIVLADYLGVADAKCGDGECQKVEACYECPDENTAKGGQRALPCTACPQDCCPVQHYFVEYFFTLIFLLILILTPVGIFVTICLCIYYRKKKRMKDKCWILKYSDIIINPGRKAMSSLHSLNKKRGSAPGSISSSLDLQAQQVFTEVGIYDGKTVAIRRVRVKRSSIIVGGGDISSQLRKEVFQIRYLDHQNLCKFIGATVKDLEPNIAIISEYCSKGSLNDVLLNEDVPLTWNFRFSFAQDIARGMAFLHSHGLTHGRLSSSNCVIDDRWVTKVTDYGLPALRYGKEAGGEEEQLQRSLPKVYRAPEVRDLPPHQPSSSPPADVYSYAIILYEIATGMDPHSDNTWRLDANLKPKINQSELNDTECPCSQDYLNLINKCWTYSPQTRLTFERIKRELRHINPSNTSAIDNMMQLMERYSKHLEHLVSERTEELEDEKERATTLLYRMIPQAVAEELKHGKDVQAEEFEGVTIFFSDIVGFTSLAGDSTPKQIVGLLNKLYTEFDQVLDQFDVYKVETIGDAYMVVSGVPTRNGDKHAGEIAKMALKLMACCETFTIPHKPDMKLRIRAGIHSGSVCAGIVGKKMPRYCLFGDTVNTASRMESNSIAMHIQCSDSTYQLLEKLGGFTLDSRGAIEVKGKGSMNTWWLKSYTEPDIVILPPPLPREDSSASPTTKEPIRDAPKKISSVGVAGERSFDSRSSTTSLTRGPSSAVLDVYKRHQSLQKTSSYSNLLSTTEAEKQTQKKSITMPREIASSDSATELPQMKRSITPVPRHSVPQVTVSTFSSGSRRLTQPNVETVGLGSTVAREPADRKTSRSSVTSRDNMTQMTVAPLDSSEL